MDSPYNETGARAPYPIISANSARASRKTSLDRPFYKSPNDVRVKPASSDVLDGLLASFSVIEPPAEPSAEPPTISSRPRTPTRSSRPSSRPPSRTAGPVYQNFSRPASIRPKNLTHDFEEVSHPIYDVLDLPPNEDAAEPPVVRTARPPSGFSKMTSHRADSLSGPTVKMTLTPRILRSPAPEREGPSSSRPGSREGRASLRGNLSPQVLGSVRESIDAERSDEDDYDLTRQPTGKGKERDVNSPGTRSMRSAAYDMQRAPPLRDGPMRDLVSERKSSVDAAGPLQSRPPPRADRESKRRKDKEIAQQSPRAVPGSRDGAPIPERLSSRNATESNSPERRRSSIQSPRPPPDQLLTQSSEPPSRNPARQTTQRSTPLTPDQRGQQAPEPLKPNHRRIIVSDDSDDTEVNRRIKELQAAKEERLQRAEEQKFPKAQKPFSMDDDPPLGPSNISQRPSQQFKPAAEVEEHRISDELERQDDNYALDIPLTVVTPSAPFNANRMQPEVAKGLTSGSAVVVSNRATARPSMDNSARHSRTNSRTKRWSPLPFASRQETRSAGSDQLPSPSMRKSTSFADTRPSFDSIQVQVRDYLASPRLSQRLQIAGEPRRVVFSEVGDPNGHAVICCVGMGLTRYIMAFYDELATSLGLRLITPDRPGIGGSDQYRDGLRTPLSWPDDVQAICDHLQISNFSLIAHSAGAIYALATALRLPHYLRGKIHLLAPWIPPSQLAADPMKSRSTNPAGNLPKSQRFLRILPTAFLKLSNASLNFRRSATPKPPKSSQPGRARRSTDSRYPETATPSFTSKSQNAPTLRATAPPSPTIDSFRNVSSSQHNIAAAVQHSDGHPIHSTLEPNTSTTTSRANLQRAYDAALTPQIWDLATRNANPSVDLLICLERNRPIGFSYTEVGSSPPTNTLAERPGRLLDQGTEVDGNQWPGMGIVIRHGMDDRRVPAENVRWLAQRMVSCEVQVLEGLGHGLMGEAKVMGAVLGDVAKEWAINPSWKSRALR